MEDRQQLTLDERKIRIEEARLALEQSFVRKWLPMLWTIMAGVSGTAYAIMQSHDSKDQASRQQRALAEEHERARLDAAEDRRTQYGLRVVEMYLQNAEAFDLNDANNREQARRKLLMLATVAPEEVGAVLKSLQTELPAPTLEVTKDSTGRYDALSAYASIEEVLVEVAQQEAGPQPTAEVTPGETTVYVQYLSEDKAQAGRAREALLKRGYKVPGLEGVEAAPRHFQIRYYYPDQKPLADQLAAQLMPELGVQGTFETSLVASTKPLPRGILELWLPEGPGAR